MRVSLSSSVPGIGERCSTAGLRIAPGADLAARVSGGRGSWVGIGSVVREGVHIGSDVMIGAGSVVLHDIPDGALAYGVPARAVRQ